MLSLSRCSSLFIALRSMLLSSTISQRDQAQVKYVLNDTADLVLFRTYGNLQPDLFGLSLTLQSFV